MRTFYFMKQFREFAALDGRQRWLISFSLGVKMLSGVAAVFDGGT